MGGYCPDLRPFRCQAVASDEATSNIERVARQPCGFASLCDIRFRRPISICESVSGCAPRISVCLASHPAVHIPASAFSFARGVFAMRPATARVCCAGSILRQRQVSIADVVWKRQGVTCGKVSLTVDSMGLKDGREVRRGVAQVWLRIDPARIRI